MIFYIWVENILEKEIEGKKEFVRKDKLIYEGEYINVNKNK